MGEPQPFDLAGEPGDPTDFPVGTRVALPTMEDFHFFGGMTGHVVRHTGRAYLGVVVRLDKPYRCNHVGDREHVIEEFGFNAANLRRKGPKGG